MSIILNDSPIKSADDDRYGVATFAKSLAQSISSIEAPVGTTIALNGPWGSGKTSVINMVRHEIEDADDDIVISDFKCWWYKGQDAFALAFLQNLNALLTSNLPDKVKGLVPQIGQLILQAGPNCWSSPFSDTNWPVCRINRSRTEICSAVLPRRRHTREFVSQADRSSCE